MYKCAIIAVILAATLVTGGATASAPAPMSAWERTCLVASLELRLEGMERRRRYLERDDDRRTLRELWELREGQRRILAELRALGARPVASPFPSGPYYVVPPSPWSSPAAPPPAAAPWPVAPPSAAPWPAAPPSVRPGVPCPVCPPAGPLPAPRTDDDYSRGRPAPDTSGSEYMRYTRGVRRALYR